MKKRIDLLLFEKKLAESRSKAQAMIMAGQVFINGRKVLKSGEIFAQDSKIVLKNLHNKWVSRGSLKLLHGLNNFKIDVQNFICLDLGASTGGFTQVLLSKKVKKIYAVDVGSNQLHEKLINNPKVINIPKTNARYLTKDIIKDVVDIIVCDVSFISLKKIIKPNLLLLKKSNGIIICLIKPQFESKKQDLKKGGIVKDINVHKKVCENIKDWFLSECKMSVIDIIPSPIKGSKGNREFLIYVKN